MRSHVDVTNEVGLDSLHAFVKVRETFAEVMNIQIVAFPQDGVVSSPGTIDLLETVIGEGADFIGGIDSAVIDRDRVANSTLCSSPSSGRALVSTSIFMNRGNSAISISY